MSNRLRSCQDAVWMVVDDHLVVARAHGEAYVVMRANIRGVAVRHELRLGEPSRLFPVILRMTMAPTGTEDIPCLDEPELVMRMFRHDANLIVEARRRDTTTVYVHTVVPFLTAVSVASALWR